MSAARRQSSAAGWQCSQRHSTRRTPGRRRRGRGRRWAGAWRWRRWRGRRRAWPAQHSFETSSSTPLYLSSASRGTECADSSNPSCHTHGAGGSGGGAHGWATPHPMRISRAALGSAVVAPQRAVSTLRATPVLHKAVCVVLPGWPALMGKGREWRMWATDGNGVGQLCIATMCGCQKTAAYCLQLPSLPLFCHQAPLACPLKAGHALDAARCRHEIAADERTASSRALCKWRAHDLAVQGVGKI